MSNAELIAATTAAAVLVEQGIKILEERKRKRELTPEEEALWDRFVADRMTKPHWQPAFQRPR